LRRDIAHPKRGFLLVELIPAEQRNYPTHLKTVGDEKRGFKDERLAGFFFVFGRKIPVTF
jgi:hypothetical protein